MTVQTSNCATQTGRPHLSFTGLSESSEFCLCLDFKQIKMSKNISEENRMEKFSATKTAAATGSAAGIFMQHVYSWMFAGLLLTALTAYLFSMPPLLYLIANSVTMIVLFLATLGLVFYLTARIDKLSAKAATGFFLLYAGLNGITLAPIFIVYTTGDIFMTFAITSIMFGALALYGMSTKRDLSPVGTFMFMGLIGIILASVINIFVESSAMTFVINVIGVIVFAGLTAYDNQKIRQMGDSAPLDDSVAIRRGAILGALTLYLDFINLFLFLLRLVGGNRD